MDMQKIPPVQQKRIITFVNTFLIETVSLLNKLIDSSESTLWRLEKRMRKLDTTLKLLETKLNFIPDAVENNIISLEVPKIVSESDEKKEIEPEHSNLDTPLETLEVTVKETLPELKKYQKMVQVGVPIQAVKSQMRRDGIDPELL